MTPMGAFIGLLVLAYLGNVLMGDRSVRGYGLPSGSEYLLLGFVLGPTVFGVVGQDTLVLMDPFLHVGVGWLALLTGLNWGVIGGRRARLRGFLGSFLLALLSGSFVGGAVYFISERFAAFDFQERLLLAGATAAVGMETTRIAVRWVFERHGASGPLTRSIATLADSDELPALLLVAFLFVLVPLPDGRVELPWYAWLSVTLGLGLVLGITCLALIGRTLHHGEAIGFVLGAALLGIGVSVQLGLAGISMLFVLGLTLARASKHRGELRALLNKSEQPVLLPVLLLSGAHLVLDSTAALGWIVAAALVGRLVGKLLSGWLLSLSPAGRPAGPLLGLGLLPSGVITLAIGLSVALRFKSSVGDVTLVVAAALALFGEAIGPLSLRRALERAGELGAPPASPRTPASATDPHHPPTEGAPSP